MSRDQVVGAFFLVAGIAGILVYAWLVFLTAWWDLILRFTGFIAVGGILTIVSWIGWTLATTPPPKPLEMEEFKEEKASEEGAA